MMSKPTNTRFQFSPQIIFVAVVASVLLLLFWGRLWLYEVPHTAVAEPENSAQHEADPAKTPIESSTSSDPPGQSRP